MNGTYNNAYINTNTGTTKKIKNDRGDNKGDNKGENKGDNEGDNRGDNRGDNGDSEDPRDVIVNNIKNMIDIFSTCSGIDARIDIVIDIFSYILTIPKFMTVPSKTKVKNSLQELL